MQLDQSRIAICERSWSENLDLALHVLRAHAAGIAGCAVAGMGPFVLLNVVLVNWLRAHRLSDEMAGPDFVLSVFLVMIEAPLATAPMTLYLGKALFDAHPSARMIARDLSGCLGQLILLQGVVRFLFIVPVVTWFGPFVLWPFLNEVILLERNPLVARSGQISTLKRNSVLHRDSGGEFLARGILVGLLALLLIFVLAGTQNALLESLLGLQPGWIMQLIGFQAVLWLVVTYFTAARFLSYLDQRIRIEGWEVELLLRAQRDRLMGPIA